MNFSECGKCGHPSYMHVYPKITTRMNTHCFYKHELENCTCSKFIPPQI